ncbi:hypothetical protein EsH8_X_000667 [Colletotrichum jinshuiense]
MTSEKTETPVTEKPVDEPSPASSAQGHEPNQNNAFFKQVASFFGDWYYVWEVFGIAVSGLAIIVICMIVHYYDGKEIPNWTARVPGRKSHFRLTINSLLSIISVLGSTCAMIPVTKGLGQLKYLWFIEQDRKLADLEIFDSASRGKLGSARLIWKLRFKHLAALGGLASLLALAYGPFVQNLLITAIKYRPADDNALLSFSLTYNSELNNGTDGLMWINIDDLSHIRNISKQQADQFMRPRMSEITYKGLRGYLRGILGGYLWSMPNATEFGYTYEMTAIQRMYNHTIDKTWTPIHCNGSNEATKTDGVACGMNKVAAALTNAFRLADWQTQNEDSRSVIRGTTKVARQICTAQWQYVSAPLAVWILGLVLFIGVVIKTRRAKIKTWRTSPLATLLMNLDPDSREHLKDWQHMGDAELQTVAQELRLRLHMDENGPRFVRKNV